jgi:hypothetical protein
MGFVQKTTGIDIGAPVKAVQSGIKAIQNAPGISILSRGATQALQPIEKAVVQPVGRGLASFDKAVGKTIPGGWGTVAAIAGSAMGVPTPYMVGLGALNGSGVMKKGGSFNLQGAIVGGAMAYAASELGEYARGASDGAMSQGASTAVESAAENAGKVVPMDAIEALNASQGWTGPAATNLGSNISQGAIESANAISQAASNAASNINPATGLDYAATGSGFAGNGMQPSIGSQIMSGNFGDAASQVGQNIYQGGLNAADSAGNFFDKATTLDTYTQALDKGLSNAGDTFSGIKNLVTGAPGASQAAAATAKAAGTMSPLMAAGVVGYSAMTLQALQNQKLSLQEQLSSGEITDEAYQAAVASIDAQIAQAQAAVDANPLQSSVDSSNVKEGESLYDKTYDSLYAKNTNGLGTLYDKDPRGGTTIYEQEPVGVASGGMIKRYAAGGVVQQDDQTGLINQSPMTNINNQSSYRTLPDLGPSFNWGNMQAYQGTREQESAQMAYNQANGIQTIGGGGFSNMQQPQPSSSSPKNAFFDEAPNGGTGYSGGLGGMTGGVNNAFPLQGQYGIVKMASGGMTPRFLSGGGDGMSDSIKANINGTQEARLADGEFVIPADVVSHLGNGSSKAGAKQLYSMMDKVRKARTGNSKQGKQINPRKYLAA